MRHHHGGDLPNSGWKNAAWKACEQFHKENRMNDIVHHGKVYVPRFVYDHDKDECGIYMVNPDCSKNTFTRDDSRDHAPVQYLVTIHEKKRS
jgi:hypothetical protein